MKGAEGQQFVDKMRHIFSSLNNSQEQLGMKSKNHSSRDMNSFARTIKTDFLEENNRSFENIGDEKASEKAFSMQPYDHSTDKEESKCRTLDDINLASDLKKSIENEIFERPSVSNGSYLHDLLENFPSQEHEVEPFNYGSSLSSYYTRVVLNNFCDYLKRNNLKIVKADQSLLRKKKQRTEVNW